MRTIVHISDLHVGPPFQPAIAERLVEEVREIGPDLMVITGDLVQDHDPQQFRQAAAYVARFDCSLVMVPGNHDVPGLNLLARFVQPYELYRRTFGLEWVAGMHVDQGLAVVGLNSVWTLAPSGGRLSGAELGRLRTVLETTPDRACRIVAMHHHLVPMPGFGRRTVIWGAPRALRVMERAGVELVLSGHNHRSYIGNIVDFYRRARRPLIVVQAGTATSRRGRGPERERNSYNVIRITERTIRITHRLYFADEGRFHRLSEHLYPRFTMGAAFLEPLEPPRDLTTAGPADGDH